MVRPIVALVGRPNVGKSTLFNRLVGRRQAIVEDTPGTTRDRLYGEAEWAGVEFVLVDTGGMEVIPASGAEGQWQPLAAGSVPYVQAMKAQAEIAIQEADLVVLVVDAAAGLTAADEAVAEILRRTDKPVLLAANKADSPAVRQSAAEFYALGLGHPFPVSAIHGTGTGDLLDEIVARLASTAPTEEAEAEGIQIAIVGRPNVGKSSLLNCILGEERVIVSDIPGTTRDAIDTQVSFQGQTLTLIDTAGIRRRGKVEPGIEKYSVLRALRAVERADVALLLLDATQMVTAQDAHVAGYILEARKSVVVVVNKWDLAPAGEQARADALRQIRAELRFLDYAPVHFASALTGKGVFQALATAVEVYQQRHQRVPTAALNRLIREAVTRINPPSKGGRRLRIYYATQADVDPPTFVLFVNDRRLAHFGFTRFIENRIREQYPFTGTPIVIEYRHDERKENR
ncbi:MAG: ribosome biogenesis GTPase Der [Anaerolineae bacterium]|nr:ribosome biogenesis GTPase Der [Anaerolineae bacterium]